MIRVARDIEPASFLRLREVELQWSLPDRAARTVGAERLSIRIIGQNLALWTRYRGIDPEVGESTPDAWSAPIDAFSAPLPRRVLLELRAGTRIGGGG